MRTPRRLAPSLLALGLALSLATLPAACGRAPTASADSASFDETPPPPPDTTGRGPGSNGPPY